MSEIFYDKLQESKKLHYKEEGFTNGFKSYEVQNNDGSETIFSITSKMGQEHLKNEQKTIFRNIILNYAEKNGFPILKKGDNISFGMANNNKIELNIKGETYIIHLINKTMTKKPIKNSNNEKVKPKKISNKVKSGDTMTKKPIKNNINNNEKVKPKEISYKVKSGDTMLGILQNISLDGKKYIISFINANYGYKFFNLRVGDTIKFSDHGDYYHLSVNGKTYNRSDGKNIRFFKSSKLSDKAKELDKKELKKQQEEAKKQEKENKEKLILKQEQEIENILPGITLSNNGNYSISYNGVKLNMIFKNLDATKNAVLLIKKIKNLYDSNFKDKKPEFYYKSNLIHDSINVDNGIIFDTKYISYNKMDEVFGIRGNTPSIKDSDFKEFTDFLNKTIRKD